MEVTSRLPGPRPALRGAPFLLSPTPCILCPEASDTRGNTWKSPQRLMLSPLQVFVQHHLLQDPFPDSLARPGSPLSLPARSARVSSSHGLPPVSFHVSLCCSLALPLLIQQPLLINPCVPGTVLDKAPWGQEPAVPCSIPRGQIRTWDIAGCLHHDMAAKVHSFTGVSQSRV